MTPHHEPILYLDNNATTAVDPAVVEEMLPYLREAYGNPSSIYRFGRRIGKVIETARERVAGLLGCEPEEVIFTSCGTESDNAAIASALRIDPDRSAVVTTSVEHSAIVKQCDRLARQGHPVTRVRVNAGGQLDLDQLEKAITDETAIVSVMWANNETGILFPAEGIAKLCASKGVLFHTDAVQAVGKIPISLRDSAIHLLSLSGHKLHCPKGVGALYVKSRTPFYPYLHGGGQEGGRRAGTENVASIVALGKAAELAAQNLAHENTEVRKMRDAFEARVLERISGASLNGDPEPRLPNTTSVAIEGADGEALLLLLDQEGVCASAGSACTTGSLHPSHVLTAMGCSPERARGTLRFSFGRFNTFDEAVRAAEILERAVAKLRALRPPGPVAVAG